MHWCHWWYSFRQQNIAMVAEFLHYGKMMIGNVCVSRLEGCSMTSDLLTVRQSLAAASRKWLHRSRASAMECATNAQSSAYIGLVLRLMQWQVHMGCRIICTSYVLWQSHMHPDSFWAWYLTNHLGEFHRIYSFRALRTEDELVRIWDQEVKGQGHNATKCRQIIYFWCHFVTVES